MNASVLRWGRRGAIGVAILLVLGFGVGSLATRTAKHSAQTSAGPGVLSGTGTVDVMAQPAAPGAAARAEAAKDADTGLPGLPDRVVRNADLTLQIRKGRFDEAWSAVGAVATRFGGYVASSNRGAPAPVPVPLESESAAQPKPSSGDVTIRVPARSFEQARSALRALGVVTADQTSSQDVTQEFVDLHSRLRNQKAQEAVLLRLMAAAKTVGESLSVQSQLSRTQDEIEQISGRINVLEKMTDLSTINVHFFEPGAAGAPPETQGPSFAKAWHTAVVGLERMGTVAMIGGLWLVPFAVLALVALSLRRRTSPAAPIA